MKDKRNCGVPYPVYPQVIIPPVQTPYMAGYNQGYNTSSIQYNDKQINNLEERLNNIETRISRLENIMNNNSNNNQYNGSNYYMV